MRQFVREFVHFFALMLWAAAALALVAGLEELAIAIVAIVVANAAFAFAQEHRAERAVRVLRDLVPRRAMVVRDGREVAVDASQLVVDDLIVLRAGDGIGADAILTDVYGLMVDESMLAGRASPCGRRLGPWSGQGPSSSRARPGGRVVATGPATRVATIAALTHAGTRPAAP